MAGSVHATPHAVELQTTTATEEATRMRRGDDGETADSERDSVAGDGEVEEDSSSVSGSSGGVLAEADSVGGGCWHCAA
jgi:hypothetical protein